jgi:DNA repair exonuclease SbcCD nuclease subunit
MAKTLFVGDLHAQIGNIEDTNLIFEKIRNIIKTHNIYVVVFLGDLYHTHSVLRQEVIACVKAGIKSLKIDCIVLVGNHDLVGPKNSDMDASTLTLSSDALVINKPTCVNEFVFVPYMPSNEDFVAACNKFYKDGNEDKILVVHQSFNGVQFENGFFDPHGVDRSLVFFKEIISGHIHIRFEFAGITYVGSPRALAASEANQEKFLMIHDTETKIKEWIPIGNICKRFFRYDVSEEQGMLPLNFPLDLTLKDDVRVYITGSADFCKEASLHYSTGREWLKIIPVPTQALIGSLGSTETEDIATTFKKYLDQIEIKDAWKERLWKKMNQIRSMQA